MVAFLGLVVFPRKDRNIDLKVAGIVKILITNDKSILAPMIMSEIYRALTACKAGADFFEGCNLLLQMWMIEHLCHHPQYMRYMSTNGGCIEGYSLRVSGFRSPGGFEEWISYLRVITADQINWTLGWLSVEEIIYMPATGPHFLLMGLRGIQPYAPYRVMRQLGRCQVLHPDEDLSTYAVEVSSDGQFPEKTVRCIWSECQYLTANTRVNDVSRGEVSPAYLTWHNKKNIVKRPTKRPHLQDFVESSQEQWDWLAKEEGYLVEIRKLKRQVERIVFENNVQVAQEQAEKDKLAQENQTLKARLRQASKNNIDRQKRCSDERLIASLRNQVIQSQEELDQSEACIARMRVKWAEGTMARRKRLQQVMRNCELSVKAAKETNSALQERIFKQTQDAQADRRRYYNAMTRMERQMDMFQDQLATNAQTLGLKSRQIRQLFAERDNIRARIDEIGHYIYLKCLACEQTPRETLIASIMGCVHRIMNELKSLQRDLTPRAAKGPKDASWVPKLEN